jgi:hypothetical protein
VADTPDGDQLAQLRAEVARFRGEHAGMAEELNRVFKRLGGIADNVDELLADSRRARPLLDKYERLPQLPWARRRS